MKFYHLRGEGGITLKILPKTLSNWEQEHSGSHGKATGASSTKPPRNPRKPEEGSKQGPMRAMKDIHLSAGKSYFRTQIFEKQARKSVYCGSYGSLFSHDQDKKSS